MKTQICPSCGRLETDATARFCEIDGVALLPMEAMAPDALVKGAQQPVDSRAPDSRDSRASTSGPGPRAIPITSRGGTSRGPSPDNAAGGDASARLFVALVFSTILVLGVIWARHRLVPSHPAEKPVSTEPATQGVGGQTSRAEGIQELLQRCYETLPPLPGLVGGAEGDSLESSKDTVKLGSDLGTEVLGSDVSLEGAKRIGRAAAAALEMHQMPGDTRRERRRLKDLSTGLIPFAPRHETLQYSFKVMVDERVNAFVLPGGLGYINTGLMAQMPSDAQLAFVIGHELAHSECGHITRMVKLGLAGKTLGAAVFGPGGEDTGGMMGSVLNHVLKATYDQDQEFEADRMGLCFARLAGFPPEGVAAMQTLMAESQSGPETAPPGVQSRIAYDVISTHPHLPDRMRYLELLQKRLKP